MYTLVYFDTLYYATVYYIQYNVYMLLTLFPWRTLTQAETGDSGSSHPLQALLPLRGLPAPTQRRGVWCTERILEP